MTVEEVLKATGVSDEQIKALDPKIVEGVTKVLTTATDAQKAGEEALRLQREAYDKDIAPALDNWANEKAAFAAREAAYQAALKSAAEGGFKVPEILATPVKPAPVQGADGRFVAGNNPVPGSPGVDTTKKLTEELGSAFAFAADTQWKYRKLFGQEMPDSPTAIIREATAKRMSPSEYAAQKYNFAGKEKEIAEKAQKDHDDAIRKEVAAAKDKEWGEKVGSNPDLRRSEVSRFSEINKAVKAGTRPDPLAPGLSETQRDANTRTAIRAEIAQQQTGTA